jgi:hypothetical protein
MGRRLVAIVIGAHAVRAFAVISPTSHHGVWGGASFKINGKKRQFLSQLTKEQTSKASGLAPHYLYRRGKPKQPFGTHAQDSARCARSLGFFATEATQCLTHCEWGLSPHVNNIDPLSMVRQRGSSTFLSALAPTSQQPGTTRRVGRKSVKEL